MTCYMLDREALQQGRAQARKCLVLRFCKGLTFEPLELNADRVVIAVGAAAIVRDASVPGAVFTTDKLPELSGALNKEMTRDLEAFYSLVVGVLIPVKLVGEKALHGVSAVGTGGKADGVQNDQVDLRCQRALAIVGRRPLSGEPVPPIAP